MAEMLKEVPEQEVETEEVELTSRSVRIGTSVNPDLDTLETIERLSMAGVMAAAVGHDLNNVAHVFSVTLELIEMDVAAGSLPDEETVNDLKWARDRMTQLADYLQFLRRPGDQETEVVNLVDIAENVLKTLSETGKSKHLNVITNFSVQEAPIECNPAKIRMVLSSLLMNAIDAAMDGADERRIGITVKIDDGLAVCEVDDSGPGIPAIARSKMFEPFFSTKTPDRATGLGLSLAKEIAESYGGSLKLIKSDNTGSTFCARMPLANSKEISYTSDV